MVSSLDYDLIIVGSGLAGLRGAIQAARRNSKIRIGVISKVQVMRSHSVSAEGGTAAVLFPEDGDSIESHIYDTVRVCYEAFKADKCKYYSISNKKSYSILEIAKLFKSRIVFLKPRLGERYASALTKISYNNKITQKYGKLQLKDYISSFIKSS